MQNPITDINLGIDPNVFDKITLDNQERLKMLSLPVNLPKYEQPDFVIPKTVSLDSLFTPQVNIQKQIKENPTAISFSDLFSNAANKVLSTPTYQDYVYKNDPALAKFDEGYNPNKSYAENDAAYYDKKYAWKWWSPLKLFTNFIPRVGYAAGESLAKMALSVPAMMSSIDKITDSGEFWSSVADNELLRRFDNASQELREKYLPVYKSLNYDDKGFFAKLGDSSFYRGEAADTIGNFLAYFVPGGVAAKGLMRLGKFATAEATGTLGGALEFFTGAKSVAGIGSWAINTHTEATMEALDTAKQIRESMTEQGYSEDEIKEAQGRGASLVYNGNLAALGLSNSFSNKLLFKFLTPKNASSFFPAFSKISITETLEAIKQIPKNGIGKFLSESAVGKRLSYYVPKAVKGFFYEGGEENAQLALQRLAELKYGQGYYIRRGDEGKQLESPKLSGNSIYDFTSQLFRQTIQAIKGVDVENSVAIGLGGLLGFGGEVVTGRLAPVEERIPIKDENGIVTGYKTKKKYFQSERKLKENALLKTIAALNDARENFLNLNQVINPDGTIDQVKLEAIKNKMKYLTNMSNLSEDISNPIIQNHVNKALFSEFVLAHIMNGTYDQFLSQISNPNTNPSLLALQGLSTEVKSNIGEYAELAKKAKQIYDKVLNIKPHVLEGEEESLYKSFIYNNMLVQHITEDTTTKLKNKFEEDYPELLHLLDKQIYDTNAIKILENYEAITKQTAPELQTIKTQLEETNNAIEEKLKQIHNSTYSNLTVEDFLQKMDKDYELITKAEKFALELKHDLKELQSKEGEKWWQEKLKDSIKEQTTPEGVRTAEQQAKNEEPPEPKEEEEEKRTTSTPSSTSEETPSASLSNDLKNVIIDNLSQGKPLSKDTQELYDKATQPDKDHINFEVSLNKATTPEEVDKILEDNASFLEKEIKNYNDTKKILNFAHEDIEKIEKKYGSTQLNERKKELIEFLKEYYPELVKEFENLPVNNEKDWKKLAQQFISHTSLLDVAEFPLLIKAFKKRLKLSLQNQKGEKGEEEESGEDPSFGGSAPDSSNPPPVGTGGGGGNGGNNINDGTIPEGVEYNPFTTKLQDPIEEPSPVQGFFKSISRFSSDIVQGRVEEVDTESTSFGLADFISTLTDKKLKESDYIFTIEKDTFNHMNFPISEDGKSYIINGKNVPIGVVLTVKNSKGEILKHSYNDDTKSVPLIFKLDYTYAPKSIETTMDSSAAKIETYRQSLISRAITNLSEEEKTKEIIDSIIKSVDERIKREKEEFKTLLDNVHKGHKVQVTFKGTTTTDLYYTTDVYVEDEIGVIDQASINLDDKTGEVIVRTDNSKLTVSSKEKFSDEEKARKTKLLEKAKFKVYLPHLEEVIKRPFSGTVGEMLHTALTGTYKTKEEAKKARTFIQYYIYTYSNNNAYRKIIIQENDEGKFHLQVREKEEDSKKEIILSKEGLKHLPLYISKKLLNSNEMLFEYEVNDKKVNIKITKDIYKKFLAGAVKNNTKAIITSNGENFNNPLSPYFSYKIDDPSPRAELTEEKSKEIQTKVNEVKESLKKDNVKLSPYRTHYIKENETGNGEKEIIKFHRTSNIKSKGDYFVAEGHDLSKEETPEEASKPNKYIHRGIIVDSLFREFIKNPTINENQFYKLYLKELGKILQEKPENTTDEQYEKELGFSEKSMSVLLQQYRAFKIANPNLIFISDFPKLWGSITIPVKMNGEIKEITVNVAGEIDIFAIDKHTGEFYTIDLKSSKNLKRDSILTEDADYISQQTIYNRLIEQRLGIAPDRAYLLHLNLSLDSNTTKENIMFEIDHNKTDKNRYLREISLTTKIKNGKMVVREDNTTMPPAGIQINPNDMQPNNTTSSKKDKKEDTQNSYIYNRFKNTLIANEFYLKLSPDGVTIQKQRSKQSPIEPTKEQMDLFLIEKYTKTNQISQHLLNGKVIYKVFDSTNTPHYIAFIQDVDGDFTSIDLTEEEKESINKNFCN